MSNYPVTYQLTATQQAQLLVEINKTQTVENYADAYKYLALTIPMSKVGVEVNFDDAMGLALWLGVASSTNGHTGNLIDISLDLLRKLFFDQFKVV